jgi:tetratricopeptide (TPR) repeat protein
MTSVCYHSLGELERRSGQRDAARSDLERALSVSQVAGSDSNYSIDPLISLGSLAEAGGDAAAAESFLRRALTVQERAHGPEDGALHDTLTALAAVVDKGGDARLARELRMRADHLKPTTATSANFVVTADGLLETLSDSSSGSGR